MSPRFQADADFNQKVVAAAIRREPLIDFRTAKDAGLPGLKDPAVLALAAADRRVLVTHDLKTMPRHFGEFLQTSTSSGVIIVPQHMPIAEAAEELIFIWSVSTQDEWINRIYVVPS